MHHNSINRSQELQLVANDLAACDVDTETIMVHCIALSGLFDVQWYLDKYPDVAASEMDPILHYVRHGAQDGREPAPWFDAKRYLQEHTDVLGNSENIFYFYILFQK